MYIDLYQYQNTLAKNTMETRIIVQGIYILKWELWNAHSMFDKLIWMWWFVALNQHVLSRIFLSFILHPLSFIMNRSEENDWHDK